MNAPGPSARGADPGPAAVGPGPAASPAVLVMAKAPLPGTVKTRLHALLGSRGCAELQSALLAHTVELTAGWPTFLAYDPPDAEDAVRCLVPPGVRLLPQRGSGLGERLAAAVEDVCTLRPGPVVVLGTDAPTLTADRLAAAFTALDSGHDVVLGPALDGGYYLIGMRRPQTRLFGLDPALWGGDQVLASTLAIADRAGLRTVLLPPLRDLDTPEDAAVLLGDPLLPARIAAALSPAEVAP
ncbi:MAG: glycosyltransferase [Streptomyces sp.]|nr:glycosyltransferase [Streptomyces sp.]